MDQINTFTSTGRKLMHYPSRIADFRHRVLPSLITLQIAPTAKCNLNCIFCSNVNRDKSEELDIREVSSLFTYLFKTKGLEITGGGEPLLYSKINELISYAFSRNMKIGLITNGTQFDHLEKESLEKLSWIRISMNCLDYVDQITIPEFNGVLGFSYVINDLTFKKNFDFEDVQYRIDPIKYLMSGGFSDIMQKLKPYVEKNKPSYVRIVPNCQVSDKGQELNNKYLRMLINYIGAPYFYQTKTFSHPKECWWCYFKPFILHDGWVYPCSSVVLNENADRQFHHKYRWVRMEELPLIYKEGALPYSTENCNHCVFGNQNEMLSDLLEDSIHDAFI